MLSRTTLRSARGNREDRPKETRRRPLPTYAGCVRHGTSCSRCHATLCTIDLRRLIDGCRHYAVRFKVVVMILSSVRGAQRDSRSLAPWCSTCVSTCTRCSWHQLPVTFWRRFHHRAASGHQCLLLPEVEQLASVLIVRVSHCCVRCA